MATKTELRQTLKKGRLALAPLERKAKSTAILGRLWEMMDWSEVASVHCFEPIERLGEVDISDFIEALRAEHPRINFYTLRQIDGSWKTFSLDGRQKSTPLGFDVIIVPMLGFDSATRNRVGYGGGFYDRFLATQPTAKKIGVCFDVGKLDHIPTESHDIALNAIITETNTYKK